MNSKRLNASMISLLPLQLWLAECKFFGTRAFDLISVKNESFVYELKEDECKHDIIKVGCYPTIDACGMQIF